MNTEVNSSEPLIDAETNPHSPSDSLMSRSVKTHSRLANLSEIARGEGESMTLKDIRS
jgi:hypothetical protein